MNYQTSESVNSNKINTFRTLLNQLGGAIIFNKPLMIRETPHTPSTFIQGVNTKTDIESIYPYLDTIIQQLKLEIYRNGSHQGSHI